MYPLCQPRVSERRVTCMSLPSAALQCIRIPTVCHTQGMQHSKVTAPGGHHHLHRQQQCRSERETSSGRQAQAAGLCCMCLAVDRVIRPTPHDAQYTSCAPCQHHASASIMHHLITYLPCMVCIYLPCTIRPAVLKLKPGRRAFDYLWAMRPH